MKQLLKSLFHKIILSCLPILALSFFKTWPCKNISYSSIFLTLILQCQCRMSNVKVKIMCILDKLQTYLINMLHQ